MPKLDFVLPDIVELKLTTRQTERLMFLLNRYLTMYEHQINRTYHPDNFMYEHEKSVLKADDMLIDKIFEQIAMQAEEVL